MIYRLIIFFVIFSVIGASVLEAMEVNLPAEDSRTSTSKDISSNECGDCQDDACAESSDCCEGSCGCSGSFFISINSEISFVSIPIRLKAEWKFFDNYHPPFIDPGLKPPLFS